MDVICFCHIRWNFVYQRPQHLMTRFAKSKRVFFVEEPVFDNPAAPYMEVKQDGSNLWIITPHLLHGYSADENIFQQKMLLSDFYNANSITKYIHWYYTPMALIISNHLKPKMIIYDCMDELSNFKFAPAEMKQKEKELFRLADLVFTGGHHLYEAKKSYHNNIFPFPSSIDKAHFEKARKMKATPPDQCKAGRPILGFYGVIDERFNVDLLGELAIRRPHWSFVIIGPVVKIDPSILPALPNIHYLGGKNYDELPAYLSGWDIAMIPFLLNESTKYISPTKTPEYLAAGVPVISSSIADVVNPYGNNGFVHIADDADTFIELAEKEIAVIDKTNWLERVDSFLKLNSWDKTFDEMVLRINSTLHARINSSITVKKKEAYV